VVVRVALVDTRVAVCCSVLQYAAECCIGSARIASRDI